MKLITEEVQNIQYIIEEDKNTNKKNYFIEGVFMMAERPNKNGRIYKFSTLKNEVDRYKKEYIDKNRGLGELGHPSNPAINLDRVSHMVTDLYPQGNDFIGKAKLLDTPMGNIAKGLLDGGVTLGVSTRGVGSLKPYNGYQLVQDDFKLAAAADIVADPSAPNAFVQGIMENCDWWYDAMTNTWHQRYIEESRKVVKKASKREIESVALRLFENFISKI